MSRHGNQADVQAQTPLTTTVKLAPGFTLSPAGAFAFEDGMTVEAIKTATSTIP